MPDLLGLLEGIAVMALAAVLVVALMMAGMLAWGFRSTMSRHVEEDPPAVVELKRRLDGGEISLVEYEEGLRALRRRR